MPAPGDAAPSRRGLLGLDGEVHVPGREIQTGLPPQRQRHHHEHLPVFLLSHCFCPCWHRGCGPSCCCYCPCCLCCRPSYRCLSSVPSAHQYLKVNQRENCTMSRVQLVSCLGTPDCT